MSSDIPSGHNSLYNIEKLTEGNWVTWKMLASTVLEDRGLWRYVVGDKSLPPPAPNPPKDELDTAKQAAAAVAHEAAVTIYQTALQGWRNVEQKARSQLILTVSQDLLHLITKLHTAAAIWNFLCARFETRTIQEHIFIR